MARQIQIRRGTAEEHEQFTGAIGEITMDTTLKTLRVHDGETLGGTLLAKHDEIPKTAIPDYAQTSSSINFIANAWFVVPVDGYLRINCMANENISWLTTFVGTETHNVSFTTQVNSPERGFDQLLPVKQGQKAKIVPRGVTISSCSVIPMVEG